MARGPTQGFVLEVMEIHLFCFPLSPSLRNTHAGVFLACQEKDSLCSEDKEWCMVFVERGELLLGSPAGFSGLDNEGLP